MFTRVTTSLEFVHTLLSQPTPIGSDLVPISSCGHASPIRPAPPIEHHAPNLLFQKFAGATAQREIKQVWLDSIRSVVSLWKDDRCELLRTAQHVIIIQKSTRALSKSSDPQVQFAHGGYL
ncbi:hypothetical protein PGT21_005007 [Puccinia graminis f. sp. tritici]|uniref:Uncharacterized protein n=1 Tax=Puccinia graminis f. sp. tritici TaxID=56615 RepID=A0A5B0RWW7_PUCGR|nr:hypothetical protein PGT21_005007 [Puccinia graminis f. sp. tritici]KAA1129922.1 hypothetical protein PGTUg99_003356 [Puccinia graminis f. sp. tritici]